ncbi:T-cell activation inhibitor, mitochondrial isoform X2 [Cavia porcellus]|uniref:T-cell activation inhibitor, mitochondrial isoform X2 n=1 Tax=Cavia porcellus TaxID=10141 RepID=UPI000661E49D|nr:T-cell activation inhibitor, mitochondrial isoform X2 [Cavia porcellus]
MFRHLRPLRRFCPEQIRPHGFHYSRALSGAEAATALRPFYFAVHPDFFGQHPREREVNENSLKRLSVYLENLQKPGFKSLKPTQLTFYVRETDQTSSDGQEPFSSSGFRAVKFTLHTRDLLSTVLYILNSCSLSVEHIQSSNTNVHSQPLREAKWTPDRPIKWNKSYYSFTGFKDPAEALEQVSRKEATLTWQRSWGVAHRCSQLHSLGRLAQQNLETLQKAKGCTLIFTDRSGVSAMGHVMLGTMDVHHHWTKLFERLPSYFDLWRKLTLLEDRISRLLGGIQVVYIEELQPALTLEEYYSLLDAFCSRLLESRVPLHPQSLRGLQMTLSSDRYAPSLHERGHFNIPMLGDPANLQWFMLSRAQQARENVQRREQLKATEDRLIQASVRKLALEKLYKEPSISSRQMVACCERLTTRPRPALDSMRLCVSHFYSVLQDGDLCIPWDWKDTEAVK